MFVLDIPAVIHSPVRGELCAARKVQAKRTRGLLQYGRGRGNRLPDQHVAVHVLAGRLAGRRPPVAHLHRFERGPDHLPQQLLREMAQHLSHTGYANNKATEFFTGTFFLPEIHSSTLFWLCQFQKVCRVLY